MIDFDVKKKNKFWAGVILYNPNTKSVLIHHRDSNILINPDMWGLFGGVGEKEETAESCTVREIKEELGIDIKEKDLTPFKSYLNEKRMTWRHVYIMNFNLDKSRMRLGEGAGFDWVPVKEVLSYNLTEKTRLDLEDFIQTLII